MTVAERAPSGIVGRLKRVPTLVWVVGGAIIVGWVILTRGSGSSTASSGGVLPGGGVSDGSGGGGGDTGTGQPGLTADDFANLLAQESQNQADFLQGVQDIINNIPAQVPGPPGPPGPPGTPGTVKPPAPTVKPPVPLSLNALQVKYLASHGSPLDAHQLHMLHIGQKITLSAHQLHLLHLMSTGTK